MSEDIIECEYCGHRQVLYEDASETDECRSCHRETAAVVVGEQLLLRGKFLYINCADVDDMIHATERRLELLRELKEDGFEVVDEASMKDDYPTLRRVDGKNKRASLDTRD